MNRSGILRAAYRANGVFSLVCAVGMTFFAEALADRFGLTIAWPIRLLGLGLTLFGAGLLWLARGRGLTPQIARGISMLDAGWVVGTVVLVTVWPDVLNPTGQSIAIAIALVVAAFGTWQLVGARHLARVA